MVFHYCYTNVRNSVIWWWFLSDINPVIIMNKIFVFVHVHGMENNNNNNKMIFVCLILRIQYEQYIVQVISPHFPSCGTNKRLSYLFQFNFFLYSTYLQRSITVKIWMQIYIKIHNEQARGDSGREKLPETS